MIKSFFAVATLFLSLQAFASVEKTVFVKGMVCAFCAQGIEKKFTKQNEIQEVNVDLENHKVVLKFKESLSLSDEKIAELLKDSGYTVDLERKN